MPRRSLNVGADIVRPQARDARPYSAPGHWFRKKAPLLKGAGTAQPWLGDSLTKAKADKGKGRALALQAQP